MHTHGYYEHKEQILKRLSRAEGQVRGVAKMVEGDKYCIDILTQVSAVQAALDKIAIELIRDHATHCLTSDGTSTATAPEKADELVGAISRMIKR